MCGTVVSNLCNLTAIFLSFHKSFMRYVLLPESSGEEKEAQEMLNNLPKIRESVWLESVFLRHITVCMPACAMGFRYIFAIPHCDNLTK